MYIDYNTDGISAYHIMQWQATNNRSNRKNNGHLEFTWIYEVTIVIYILENTFYNFVGLSENKVCHLNNHHNHKIDYNIYIYIYIYTYELWQYKSSIMGPMGRPFSDKAYCV